MDKRDFNTWFSTFRETISTWNFYTDFEKAWDNIKDIKYELNILNSLVGSKNIEKEFLEIVKRFPTTLKALPILIAKREDEIKIVDCGYKYAFNFSEKNYSDEEYALFMRKSGLFDLFENKIISNVCDYVLGVEVGLDTHARKNRVGKAMEDLVESYLKKAGLVLGKTYFKQIDTKMANELFGVDLSSVNNDGKSEKRFDFVVRGPFDTMIAIENNFYSSQGSKLNETARSYEMLTREIENIPGVIFVWFTDGLGWRFAKHNLEQTFDVLPYLYNIQDLEDGILDKILSTDSFIENHVNK